MISFSRDESLFSSLKDLLTLIDQLKTVRSATDAQLIESTGIITDLKRTNEVLSAAAAAFSS